MLEFLKTYWYFIVAGLLVIVVIVFWAIEIHNSKKTKSSIEELELENKELDEQLEDKTTKNESKDEVKEEQGTPKKSNKSAKTQSENQVEEQTEKQQKELDNTDEQKEENKKDKEENKEDKQTSKSPAKAKYSVSYDKDKKDWVVKKAGSERATKRCKTKKEAMETIEKLSAHNEINISVKKKDGKFQKLDNAKKSTAKKN